MIAVFDTNVVVSCTVFKGTLELLTQSWVNKKVQLMASQDLWQEYVDVLHYKKFGLSEEFLRETIENVLRPSTLFVDAFPGKLPNPSRDPKDDLLLRVALGGNAYALVTGDKDLLTLHGKYPFVIQRPADFMSSIL